jgi:PAS domain S-box-containing protein
MRFEDAGPEPADASSADGSSADMFWADAFSADPEVGRDLAAVDWTRTPLGPPADWPQSLQTAVSILLSSRFSMWMAWGPRLTFFCNAAYRRDTLARKYPWALGRPASEVWAEIWDDIGPRIDTVLSTGKATWDEGLRLFLERSGYVEETYHTFSYSPLRDESGRVVGMLCVVREDTDRVLGERRLATLHDLGSGSSMLRTEADVLAFIGQQLERDPRDLPFTLTYLFEDDRAVLAGSSGFPAGHPSAPAELRPDGADPVWPVRAGAGTDPVLVRLDLGRHGELPTGAWSEPPTRAMVASLRQGDTAAGFLVAGLNRYRRLDEAYRGFVELVAGRVAAGIESARNYQAQLRRADELAELDRAKTTFFSNISHEFRTPLTLIMGPVQELRDGPALADDRAREDLDVVHRNALRLSKLVNTLLDFSRIEAGRMGARYEPIDLAQVTGELASVFRSAIERAGLRFTVDCRPLDEPVYVALGLWEKVVLNLLSNALKFTFDGGIGVRVERGDGQAVVTVTDTGIGVPAAEMPRLFERFRRIEHARARSNEGSGIGLALVQELVALHGGTITADSTEGEGTTFIIGLPFGSAHLPEDAVAPAADTRPVSAWADPFVAEALRWLPGEDDVQPLPANAIGTEVTGQPAHVLVVDDNADMREYLTRLLRGAGHRVSTVHDGQEALDAVRAHTPDVVISDVMMPRLDGLALVAALRADHRTAAVPVLLLSARAGEEASIEGLRAGADDYLVKPFAAAELLARVRANVELARLRTHHARWRTALVDSLQEAFFVCDEDGAVVEINQAFTDILGYGEDGLPYQAAHPWWPDAEGDPEAHRRLTEAFEGLQGQRTGNLTIPVRHRDGHGLWISTTFNQAEDPETGRHVVVGTFRDVTVEHQTIQRESARAALSTRLSQATSTPEALAAALAELQQLWLAGWVLAALFDGGPEPRLTTTEAGLTWAGLPADRRQCLADLRHRPPLTTVSDERGTGVLLDHPAGPLVLWIDLGGQRRLTGEDELLLSLLAGHLAQGLARVHQLDQQRETAIALQRAILGPSHLPEGFAVRYEPATPPLEVGGDWYDTIALPDDRIGIVVGDCVGRGLQAAAVMGQLRSACRALLLQDHSPARALMALDQFAAGIAGAQCTTAFCGVLDPASGALTYSVAGHPPGILANPDGTTRLLEDAQGVPLAVRPGLPRPEARVDLPARSTLLLYTDGLVERRRRSLYAGIEHAGHTVHIGQRVGVEALASQVMAELAEPGGYEDDVALLLYRHPAPLHLAFPAQPSELAPVRAALRHWLGQCEVPSDTVQNVLVAAGEACANAIEHAQLEAGDATIRLRAEALPHELRLSVEDTGRWRIPRPEANPHRGRGIMLMRALMGQVTITSTDAGTHVDLIRGIAT